MSEQDGSNLDLKVVYQVRKFDGRPPRKDKLSVYFRKRFDVPEKQPFEIRTGGDVFDTVIETSDWEASNLRKFIEFTPIQLANFKNWMINILWRKMKDAFN